MKQIYLVLLLAFVSSTCLADQRTKFYDLSKVSHKKPKSNIIQFYSSIDNIGNFLPVLGIQQMLGEKPDTWCAKGTVDWDFVNKQYKCGIIGGAGFFHKSFEPFWKSLRDHCKIPLIIWGVGICLPDKDPVAVDKEIVKQASLKCDLINVRDNFTAEYYNFENASITACPCIVYLQNIKNPESEKEHILYSHHDELISTYGQQKIAEIIKKTGFNYKTTSNYQTPSLGLEQILSNHYLKSNVIVTSRLHGAIIAYALGIPYIMIARDKKLNEFHTTYGNGICINTIEELTPILKNKTYESLELHPIALQPVLAFGEHAKAWVNFHCDGE